MSAKPVEVQAELVSPAPEPAVQAVAVREAGALAVKDPESILRYAVDKGAAVDVIERLMVVRRELLAEHAQHEFDSAMKAFQSECPPVVKAKGVPDLSGKIAYRYAPHEDVEEHIRPFEHKHGFTHVFDQDLDCPPNHVGAKCIVKHVAGHREIHTARYRLTTKTKMMSDCQVDAATESFCKRRALGNAFGLVFVGEDRDGRQPGMKPAGPSSVAADPTVKDLARELWKLLVPVRGDAMTWVQANQWLWREEILDGAANEACPDLSPKRFREVIAKAKERLAAQ